MTFLVPRLGINKQVKWSRRINTASVQLCSRLSMMYACHANTSELPADLRNWILTALVDLKFLPGLEPTLIQWTIH